MKIEKLNLVNTENYLPKKVDLPSNENIPVDERICSVMCSALTAMGYILPVGMCDRPSQALLSFFETSDEIDNIYKDTAPLLYKGYKGHYSDSFKPWEVHEVLAKGINLWLDEEIDTFTEISVKDISSKVSNGSAVVVSGKFDDSYELACILGTHFYVNNDTISSIDNYFERAEMLKSIETDTYPDEVYIKRFNKPTEKVNFIDFITKIKPYNNSLVKWAHIFKAPHATI